MSRPGDKCCVGKCKNNSLNSPGTKFYSFPQRDYKRDQKEKWIRAIKRKNSDGTLWQPGKRSRICSRHFIGNAKSDHPLSPSFIPTIFLEQCEKNQPDERSMRNAQSRFIRAMKRAQKKKDSPESLNRQRATTFTEQVVIEPLDEICESRPINKSVQVYFPEEYSTVKWLICNRIIQNGICEAETQANIPLSQDARLSGKVHMVADKSCGADITHADKAVGPDPIDSNSKSVFKCYTGFHGFESLTDDQDVLDLGGVTFITFNLLLKILPDNCKGLKVSKENRLLIFLFKMRLGLSFSAIGVLFGIHRSTVSRIFYTILEILTPACKKFVVWPSKETILAMMPEVFKKTFPNCRVIIDCTEFKVEQPPEVPQRVYFYSHYKKSFTIKILVGCTPNGLISFVSNSFGGRTTDSQITTQSEFLNLLEPGDVVLADKGFPEIKTIVDGEGKGVLVVMPPFLRDATFSAEQIEETQKIASVRIHVERIMQRIKTYRITSKFSISELPYANDIIFMTCVLVNLQPPILRNDYFEKEP